MTYIGDLVEVFKNNISERYTGKTVTNRRVGELCLHSKNSRLIYLHGSQNEMPSLVSMFVLKAWSFLSCMRITKLANAALLMNKYKGM